jgi:hypothetical protein
MTGTSGAAALRVGPVLARTRTYILTRLGGAVPAFLSDGCREGGGQGIASTQKQLARLLRKAAILMFQTMSEARAALT